MLGSRSRTALALATLAVALSACTGAETPEPPEPTPRVAETPPAPSTPPAPPRATEPPGPASRACYALNFNDALSPTNDSPTVDCDGAQTALTFFVGRIDNVVGGHLLAVDSARVQQSVARECPGRLERFLGGSEETLALSMLRAVWFTPTVEQSDEGADWLRCDVIALGGSDRLATLGKGRLADVLESEEGRERFAMCGTAAPDAEDFDRVLCRDPHRWRAVEVVRFEPGRYPGVEVVRERGQAPCEDAGRAVAEDPLDFEWGYEFPTADQWKAGQQFGRCWAPD